MPFGTLLEEARDLLPGAVRLRRALHERPEIGLDLPFAQDQVLTALNELRLDRITTGEALSSVVGVLEGGHPGPTIVLRGDMDALPLHEDTGLPYASSRPDAMHACGHDTHVAMLAGAGRLLAGRRGQLRGRVVLMFQPGEEGHHGARHMLQEGLLDVGPRADGSASPVTGAFALHMTTMSRSGTINLRAGTLMASSDVLRITVTGRGGHASAPHLTIDPVPVACGIVQAIQTMVSRRIDVFDPAVVTVASILAGTTNNVIPETATILGTVRAVSERTRRKVHDLLRRLAEGVASAHETDVDVEIEFGYPVTVNDEGFAGLARDTATQLLGDERVSSLRHPVMGAEDWSYVLERVPGAMVFLGGCPPNLDPHTAPPNHSNRVTFDEDAMVTGIATYAAVALRHLGSDAGLG